MDVGGGIVFSIRSVYHFDLLVSGGFSLGCVAAFWIGVLGGIYPGEAAVTSPSFLFLNINVMTTHSSESRIYIAFSPIGQAIPQLPYPQLPFHPLPSIIVAETATASNTLRPPCPPPIDHDATSFPPSYLQKMENTSSLPRSCLQENLSSLSLKIPGC